MPDSLSEKMIAMRALSLWQMTDPTHPPYLAAQIVAGALRQEGIEITENRILVMRDDHAAEGQDWDELRSALRLLCPPPPPGEECEVIFVSAQDRQAEKQEHLAEVMIDAALGALSNSARYDGPPPEAGEEDRRHRLFSIWDDEGREYPLAIMPVGVKDIVALGKTGAQVGYYARELRNKSQEDREHRVHDIFNALIERAARDLKFSDYPGLQERFADWLENQIGGDEGEKRLPAGGRRGIMGEEDEE